MYLKVFPDYCSSGLWNFEGANVDPNNEKYGLSMSVIEDLKHMQRLYDIYCDDYLPEEERKHRVINYSVLAFNIALKIKLEHCSWKIEFWNGEQDLFVQFEDGRDTTKAGLVEVFLTDTFR